MDTGQQREQWTHEEVVLGARRALLEELNLADSTLGDAFVRSPVGPRVRVGGVRASLARFAAEEVAAQGDGLRYGGFIDASDEVVLRLPGRVRVRSGVELPVLVEVPLKFAPFV